MRQLPSGEAKNRGAGKQRFPQIASTASIADAIGLLLQAGTDYLLVNKAELEAVDDRLAPVEAGTEAKAKAKTEAKYGLLTHQTIVQTVATAANWSSCDLTTLSIRSMLQPAIALTEAAAADPEQVLLTFQQHQLSHLLVLDADREVLRVITLSDVRDTFLRLNAQQEIELQQKTGKLRLVDEFEAILRRIVDHVRASLDEAQILQTAVEELGEGLGINSCNVALYDLNQGTSTIYYEYNPPLIPLQGRVAKLSDYPELYDLLLRGESLQFCNLHPNPLRGRRSILVCPIADDRQVLGDIWIINDRDYCYRTNEVRLVQQVANHCAIGLRQSRLYQAVQQQVEELTHLNGLKDDFLSTVSHELRSPIANAKMAAQMLEITLQRANLLNPESPAPLDRYLQILKDECQREINLVNDLLDLNRLNDKSEPLRLLEINLALLVPQVTQGFLDRIHSQGQELILNLSPALPPLLTEVASLERILIELINNACKYTPSGERIMISAQTQPQMLQIEVCNTGIEIPEAERDRIFDRFYRIPNSDPWRHGGTGLGLALVQRLVKRLQGEIRLEVRCNQTIFAIELPWAIEP